MKAGCGNIHFRGLESTEKTVTKQQQHADCDILRRTIHQIVVTQRGIIPISVVKGLKIIGDVMKGK